MTTTILSVNVIGTDVRYTFASTGDIFVLAADTRLVGEGYSFLYGTAAGINVTIDGYVWLQGDNGSSGSPFFFAGNDRITIGANAQMTLLSSDAVDVSGGFYSGIMLGMGGVGGTDFANHGDITLMGGGGFWAQSGSNNLRNYGSIDVTVGAFHYGIGGGDHLLNAGTITGRGAANRGIVSIEGANNFLMNTGDILATSVNSNGVNTVAVSGQTSIINSGTIASLDGSGIFGNGGSYDIRNSGTITGEIYSIYLVGDGATVTNTGHLNGDVILTVGDDAFRGIGGTVNGTVWGGLGSDSYFTSDSAALLRESLNEGTDTVNATVSFRLGTNIENLRLLGVAENGIGNGLNNKLYGNGEANRLSAGAGNDSVLGYEGDDSIGGGVGNDTMSGDDGDDRITGGTGNDQLSGNNDNDTLIGGAGLDKLTGGLDKDSFVFLQKADSGVTSLTADSIIDFLHGTDVINLAAIDAKTNNATPNDAFIFIGTAGFSGVAGQLRYVKAAGFTNVMVDMDGNSTTDMMIKLTGTISLNAHDFIL